MMRVILLLLCSIFAFSCRDEEFKGCGVDDPLELAWFKEKTELLNSGQYSEYQYFSQAEYHNSRIFVSGDCCPFCNSMTLVYDCAGNVIGYLGEPGPSGIAAGIIDRDELSHIEVVWKSDNNSCHFD